MADSLFEYWWAGPFDWKVFFMTTTTSLMKSDDSTLSNVVPFRPASNSPKGAYPFRSVSGKVRPIQANAVELESVEERLARRVERVLCALLYHTALEPGDVRGSKSFSIEKRVSRLVSRDRLVAIARAAISMDSTADLTRLAAAAIVLELQSQSRWWHRLRRSFSSHHRQINADAVAIASLLTWDVAALKMRPIDKFAQFL